MTADIVKLFFESYFGEKSTEFITLAQSGSARINFIAENQSGKYIITYNENITENNCFLYFSEIFTKLNLNTPTIFAISEDKKIYIQEFLGSKTLSEIISEETSQERITNLVKQSLEKLYTLQQTTIGKIDYHKTFEYESYDELPIMHDLYYFKNFVADVLELEYHKSTLLKEFQKITQLITQLEPKGLMIRDFQSRNIMVNKEDKVSFIDYQSAMYGPLMYDVISFLFQAKANFKKEFTDEMLLYYIHLFKNNDIQIKLKQAIEPIQLMRFSQVLGAYGFRGLIQRKQHFIASISKGIENLYNLSESWEQMVHYPEFKNVIDQLASEKTKLKIEQIIKSA